MIPGCVLRKRYERIREASNLSCGSGVIETILIYKRLYDQSVPAAIGIRNFQHMECIVRDVPVYYESYGSGLPIILIHGNTPDHRLMKGCLEPLFAQRSGWQRIYLDLPGMGRTPGKEHIKGTDDMLDVVVDFIDAIIPEQPFLI